MFGKMFYSVPYLLFAFEINDTTCLMVLTTHFSLDLYEALIIIINSYIYSLGIKIENFRYY